MPPRILLAGLRFALFWFRFGFVTCNNVEPFWKAIQMLIPLQEVLQGLRQHPLLAGHGHLGFGFHSRSLGFGLGWRCRQGWSGLRRKIFNSQNDQKKGSLTLTLRKSQGGGKEDGAPHIRQGEDLFWALTTHQSPPLCTMTMGASFWGSLKDQRLRHYWSLAVPALVISNYHNG